MLMELNRISSHLVALATGGMELGAMTPMFFGFRERELILSVFEAITGLRMNNAYIRPGGLATDLPEDGPARVRELIKILPGRLREMSDLLTESYVWKARTQGVGYLDLTGCMALGITGPVLRSTGLPHDLRKAQPYCGYETYDFDVITDDGADCYGRYLIRVGEMHESLQDRRAVPGAPGAGSGDDRGPQAGLARRPGTRARRTGQLPGPHRQIMGTSMEGLIHHFKLVTEGIRVPAGQVYSRRRIPTRRTRRAHGVRRRHPAVPGALPRSQLHQPAGGRRDVRGRHGRRRRSPRWPVSTR